MNFRELNIFLSVCEYGSMSEAAKHLYMTQPAISQAISELEEEYNVKLFDRIGKKLVLTHAGEILRDYGKKINLLLMETENTLQNISDTKAGKLKLGASRTVGTYLLPKIIGKFLKLYANVELPFCISNTTEIVNMILNSEIDLGIVEGPIHSDSIEKKHLLDDELYLICSKEHQWAKKNIIQMDDLSKADFIMREVGSGTREIFENTMKSHNIEYDIKLELNSIEAIKKAVEANLGVSVISKLALNEELKSSKLIKIEIEGIKFTRKFNIIYHKDKYLSDLHKKFIDFICSVK
ncbi:selenium metabolism-associated LysR family transcriptional regulator [Thermoanaerobacterium sp. R66]|jgi:DNA-binding transcriptional LysR family regulator|uniref:selenium metabolism-associated LysR family transcriptional regulator n=1 Tax=Thermoanaerobacterium sp. R66 TaxID=2742479 RepID=UPI0023804F5A|nr:selenium metabolism-associated LysR family transcriptional regulator [Thermoanaerobacterium sp. R66]MDE4542774.1 LysR family transcriptional regulator [Thermoanaerobacterium sp. R66]